MEREEEEEELTAPMMTVCLVGIGRAALDAVVPERVANQPLVGARLARVVRALVRPPETTRRDTK